MKLLPTEIYQKLKQLDQDVKENLKRQGIVVPVQDKDGTIKIGYYKIAKNKKGFYSVIDYRNEVVVDNINLPQTAAVLANKLALGKYIDDYILDADRRYGHALFEEQLHEKLATRNIKKNNIDYADLMFTKAKISRFKKEKYRVEIAKGFEKLMRFR